MITWFRRRRRRVVSALGKAGVVTVGLLLAAGILAGIMVQISHLLPA